MVELIGLVGCTHHVDVVAVVAVGAATVASPVVVRSAVVAWRAVARVDVAAEAVVEVPVVVAEIWAAEVSSHQVEREATVGVQLVEATQAEAGRAVVTAGSAEATLEALMGLLE